VERPGVRPFLKWVGGKRQLLPVLRRFYPRDHGRYFEPFVGSGAVFFDLVAHGRVARGVTLSDDNPDLIGCYRRVADAREDLVGHLERLAEGHTAAPREHYYRVRDTLFNPQRLEWREDGADPDRYSPELAAMLIYLNRTGYNGLFRLNASGHFNVPPGRYDRPRILDRARLDAASTALGGDGVRMQHAPFDQILAEAEPGDFAYFDPPYAPLSATANFRSYTARGFGDEDQERLQRTVIALASRGVQVLLSNSTAPAVTRLYENNDEAAAAGLRTSRHPARRAVNSKADRRGVVEELVVSNIPPLPLPAA
jgi:DNA adenine methylase